MASDRQHDDAYEHRNRHHCADTRTYEHAKLDTIGDQGDLLVCKEVVERYAHSTNPQRDCGDSAHHHRVECAPHRSCMCHGWYSCTVTVLRWIDRCISEFMRRALPRFTD